MVDAVRFSRSFWLPASAGVAWILCGEASGLLALAFALPPAFICIGASCVGLSPGETKWATSLAALGGAVGLVFGVFALVFLGLTPGVVLLALSGWTFLDAGKNAAQMQEPIEGVPAADSGAKFSAQVAVDEALVGATLLTIPIPDENDPARIEHEVAAATELFEARGWLEKSEEYHRIPLPLEVPYFEPASTRTLRGRVEFESLRFESEYEPLSDEPGCDRWLGYVANRTAGAHVLRHPGPPRPWIVCIHGYQLGQAFKDFAAFDPRVFHQQLGFNMLLPTLPLHGFRKAGRYSGDGFLSGDVLDSIHAVSQGIWDIRRLISWVRTQDAPSIGVYGQSLGGFMTSLLTGLEPGLDFAIAGIPMTDLSSTFWHHLPDHVVRRFLDVGLTRERLDKITRVVSPLELPPKVPHAGRAIFGGVGDRLVAPRQVRDLVRHWDDPAVAWYQGSHLTFVFDPGVRELIVSAARRSSS
ncbi:MAG: alpha/beta hydrolase [bacterium]|nr:alpha/beta hydrolase [bacterium]